MKKSCWRCQEIFNDHVTNHHILHEACQICSHLKRLSEISFKLTCHICLRKFKDKYTLSDHIQIHNEDNPNYCNVCQKGFSTKFNFDIHNLKIHEAKDDEFNCDQCEKTFTSPEWLFMFTCLVPGNFHANLSPKLLQHIVIKYVFYSIILVLHQT